MSLKENQEEFVYHLHLPKVIDRGRACRAFFFNYFVVALEELRTEHPDATVNGEDRMVHPGGPLTTNKASALTKLAA